MKPKILHQEAMEFSFLAKKAFDDSDYLGATGFYQKAAELETLVAEFYFDKPDLEPTRSVIIRSATFLNLKAGFIEKALQLIYFGLLNIKDEEIKEQLNNALEIAISLRNLNSESASLEYNYINILRQRSINYILEPSNLSFGHSVSLEMIKEFSESYLKSLKAYAQSKLKEILNISDQLEDFTQKEIEKIINPLITNSGYGSFKFSIANDFLSREGESLELLALKSNIVPNYHNEIFINPLSDIDIIKIKEKYTEDEINDIFRPLTKIKSNNSSYKIGYFDYNNFNKKYANQIINKQRKELLPIRQISQDDIGELESSIIHKRSNLSGGVSKKTIIKEQLKSYEVDIKSNLIIPKDAAPLLLAEDISINMIFNSNTGFRFSFDDFRVENTDIEYQKALTGFYTKFYQKIFFLARNKELNLTDQKDWEIGKKLVGNIDSLLNNS